MSFPPRRIAGGTPGDTDQADSTNNSQGLPDSIKYKDGDSNNTDAQNRAKSVLITVEDAAIRFTFGSTPTQDAGTALGHILSSGESLLLNSWAEIESFQYISKIADSHATLQRTPSY